MAGRTATVWTQEQDDRMKQMRAARATFEEIAVELNRPISTIHNRLRWISMTEEQRRARAAQIRERRRHKPPEHPYLKGYREFEKVCPVIPCPKALAERECRMNLAPRDLTAAFCGDPLPGFSALDRR